MIDTSLPPTPTQVNALPPNLRQWVCELETHCDSAGIIRENVLVREENKMLRALIAEQQAILEGL